MNAHQRRIERRKVERCNAMWAASEPYIQYDDDYDDEYGMEWACTRCGGEGIQENDDPLWHGFDTPFIDCEACNGTGERKHQTVF